MLPFWRPDYELVGAWDVPSEAELLQPGEAVNVSLAAGEQTQAITSVLGFMCAQRLHRQALHNYSRNIVFKILCKGGKVLFYSSIQLKMHSDKINCQASFCLYALVNASVTSVDIAGLSCAVSVSLAQNKTCSNLKCGAVCRTRSCTLRDLLDIL